MNNPSDYDIHLIFLERIESKFDSVGIFLGVKLFLADLFWLDLNEFWEDVRGRGIDFLSDGTS